MHDYIPGQGREAGESRFGNDIHWNATGHLWAAEALLEWLARNRHACGGADGRGIDKRRRAG